MNEKKGIKTDTPCKRLMCASTAVYNNIIICVCVLCTGLIRFFGFFIRTLGWYCIVCTTTFIISDETYTHGHGKQCRISKHYCIIFDQCFRVSFFHVFFSSCFSARFLTEFYTAKVTTNAIFVFITMIYYFY